MKAESFDQRFDASEDVTAALDLERAQRPGWEPRQLELEIPSWLLEALDREADRLDVARESMIKVWLADRVGADPKR